MIDGEQLTDDGMAAQLTKLQRTIPDLPLEELTVEQLGELQRAAANLANWTERESGDTPEVERQQ